ncbi:hypothetical protein FY136_28830 (plasmid) [Agrobacterium tumefaciens]|uniref:hypothetical protein n=1 Tax=Agrobacterium tumefaciens TaxID=358 RepID=UPI0021D0CCF8|nr:hypothetical protein [Agrobacterium tumefaciens]UXT53269.1 hypothetical protein FY136_28830 [Agrobacterium tumefaciens]
MIKQLKIYVVIAAAWGIAYAAKEFFQISDLWMAIGVIVIIALVANYAIENRLQELEARVVHKDYSGIITQLEGERHVPRHRQPESLAAGGAIANWIRPEHQRLFDDFRWFGALLNRHLPDPWAIEELPKTDARGYDAPDIGRMYEVWYNACKVGRFQVTLGAGMLLSSDKSQDERSACLELDLNYLRFIPYQDARGLLYEMAFLVGSFDKTNPDASRSKAQALATDALAGHLWEAVRSPELDPLFDFRVEGSYDLVRQQTDHWEKNGIDPMVRWGGDRERRDD